jgi:nicotinate dehydrogenase medium molybdopterin subunit
VKKRGRGLCAAIYKTGIGKAHNPGAAFIQVREDGSVVLQIGAVEIGQGSNTVFQQMCAEEIGVKLERVFVNQSDTYSTPLDMGSVASRVTYIVGNAVIRASRDVKEKILEHAAPRLRTSANNLEIRDGVVFVKNHPDRKLDFDTLCGELFNKDKELLIGKGWWAPYNTGMDPETGVGDPYATYEYASVIADVEVDTDTGLVKVLSMYVVQDVGKAINPGLVKGQIEGGIGMGVGLALTENMFPYYPELQFGQPPVNYDFSPMSFHDYLIPTSVDVPAHIEVDIVESNDAWGPYGAKGAGEFAVNPMAPAIIDAIYDAVGIRIKSLPATPEKLLAGIKAKEAEAKAS